MQDSPNPPSFREAIGGNVYAALMLRARTTPHEVHWKEVLSSDTLLTNNSGGNTASEIVIDFMTYLDFVEKRLALVVKRLTAEFDTRQRLELLGEFVETRIEYQTVSGILHMLLLTEFKEWSGMSAVTIRKGGIAVVTAKSKRAHDDFVREFFSAIDAGTPLPFELGALSPRSHMFAAEAAR